MTHTGVSTGGDLVDRFDGLLFDLDGVVYVGLDPVPHAVQTIAAARARGVSCTFVTNNASRTPAEVASHLQALGIDAESHDVVTSPQAAVSLLPGYVPAAARVLVVGGPGIEQALVDAGYRPVRGLDDDPAAVMQGFSPDLSWRDLAEATFAVRSGLPWISTNPDLTFPTPRGVAPGNGSLVDVVARAAGRRPDAVAGKPEPPLLRQAIARAAAARPLMVGDRLDTDIAAGSRIGIPSLLVFTGVATLAELLTAKSEDRPDFVGGDLRVLAAPYPRVALIDDAEAQCRTSSARVLGGSIVVDMDPEGDPWDGVRAAAMLAWRAADQDRAVDAEGCAEALAASVGAFGAGSGA